jgi:DNA-binding protein H-NS
MDLVVTLTGQGLSGAPQPRGTHDHLGRLLGVDKLPSGNLGGRQLNVCERLALASSLSCHPLRGRRKLKATDLTTMTTNQLWALHQELIDDLCKKMAARKDELERRLRELNSAAGPENLSGASRAYPRVLPKYRDPSNPRDTWAGRGKQPRWLRVQLRSGKRLDDFRIQRT